MKGSKIFAVFLFGSVVGCVGIGDSALRVKGRVVGADGMPVEDCQLERWKNDILADSQRVDSSFLTTFTLPLGKSRFSLRLNCERQDEVHDLGVIEVKGTEKYADPVDFGTIKLSR